MSLPGSSSIQPVMHDDECHRLNPLPSLVDDRDGYCSPLEESIDYDADCFEGNDHGPMADTLLCVAYPSNVAGMSTRCRVRMLIVVW